MKSSERVVVRFLAVDYEATVFVNGRFACFHAGGYEAFSVDITDLITREKETIEVKVADPLDADRPRGKQDWNENPSRCWYYQTTGIWQSVWLEGYGSDYIRSFGITPDAEKTDVRFDVSLAFFAEAYVQDWPLRMSGCVIAMIPLVVLYLIAQKYILQGVSISSGLKG